SPVHATNEIYPFSLHDALPISECGRPRALGEGRKCGMTTGLLTDLTIFALAVLVGFEVISKVPATLHTPLMSGANSIHGVVLIGDRKSTRLNSSHVSISYAVFC